MNYSKEVLRAWMRSILRDREWSAREWGRRSGVAPSTISRFLSERDASWTPSTSTINKLAEATGSSPGNFIGNGLSPERHNLLMVPLMAIGGEGELRRRQPMNKVSVTQKTGPDAFAIELNETNLTARMLEGDFLVVDPSLPKEENKWHACTLGGSVFALLPSGPGWLRFRDTTPQHVEPDQVLGVIIELNRRI